jgi:formylglycine-generating enzyme required for sulfatase activity
VLPDDQLNALLFEKLEQLTRTQATLSGQGAIGQDGGTAAAATAPGATAIGRVEGNVYLGPATADPVEALRIYRRVLFQSGGQLPLRSIDINAGEAERRQEQVGLAGVYINLNTTRQVPVKGKRDETRPLSVLEAVIANRQVVVVGDPGGGKSTFVNYLALCLAGSNVEPTENWLAHLPGWPGAEANLLPVPIILRDFARHLPQPLPGEATVCHLADFVAGWLKERQLGFGQKPLEQALEDGGAILLLDGLDEVPSVGQREFVRAAVEAFMERYPANRCLITCRTLSYQPPADKGQPDLRIKPGQIPVFELAAFDPAQIDQFIVGWYAELTRQGQVRLEDQSDLTRRLQEAVRQANMKPLAANPLLLTVMALVHTHKGRLPDARALLYEETIEVLLWRWEQVRRARTLRHMLAEAGRSELDLKRTLAELAYQAHKQISINDWETRTADIGEMALQKALLKLNPDHYDWVYEVLETIKLRAGLLIERSPGVFALPHRTFQEYLAGAHLAGRSDFPRLARDNLVGEGTKWREVILLAVGRLVHKQEDTAKPLALVAELCPPAVSTTDAAWRKAWLAGDALLEMGLHRVTDQALGQMMLKQVQERLVGLLAAGGLSARERAEVGNTLARLGDPRPEVMTVEGMHFCAVPPGPFWLGSDERDSEKPPHQRNIPYGYWLGRYPVTVAQWREYVTASGHQPKRKESLADPDNRPVWSVTWYEAVKFCEWLTKKWQAAKLLPVGWQVRLPSEAEWEKAARGGWELPATVVIKTVGAGLAPAPSGQTPGLSLRSATLPQRRYPWGKDPDPNRANYDDTGLGITSAMGCFPGGVSVYGCEEMSGNVWEWCATKWQDDYQDYQNDNTVDTKYNPRVLRGGSFAYNGRSVRCASRSRNNPDSGDDDLGGFRVGVGPLF